MLLLAPYGRSTATTPTLVKESDVDDTHPRESVVDDTHPWESDADNTHTGESNVENNAPLQGI